MGTVAGLEVGLPDTIDDVDAAWLTKVFRTSGALAADESVASVILEPFAEGLGFLSLLHRATLTYEGDVTGAPATVIVKMVTDLDVQRGIAEALLFYQRELRFYREMAPLVGFRSPTAHAAMMRENSTDFVLVMEDLSGIRGLDQAVGVSHDDALLAAETMAAMHGAFAGKDLSDLETTFLPFDNPAYRAALPHVFNSGWPGCKAEAADILTSAVSAFGDRFGELVPFFLESFTSDTLMHGDWRADNLMVDDATGEMVVIDFQIMGTGPGVYDLGYFMSQSMEPDVRQGSTGAVVERYFDALTATGTTYDRDKLVRLLGLSIAWCLIYPVAQFANWSELPEAHQETSRRMFRRSVDAIVEQNALDLIPA